MRRWVLAGLVVTTACFPESARHRRYAKLGEGAAIAGGIALQFVANRDRCMDRIGERCDDGQLDLIGLGLIFAGLAGFAATVMTTPSDSDRPDHEAAGDHVYAAPQSFCAALWSGNVPLAEAALATYVKSIGAVAVDDSRQSLRTWLVRQSCIEVDSEPEAERIGLQVTSVGTHYDVDVSATPFIVIMKR